MVDFVIKTEADREEAIFHLKNMCIKKPKLMKVNTPRRTSSQNKLYWFWCTDIAYYWNFKAEVAGPIIQKKTINGQVFFVEYDKDYVHRYFGFMWLGAERTKYVCPDGSCVYETKVNSSTDEDTAEFSNYMMKIKQVMINYWGLILDTPEGNQFTAYMKSLESS